MSCFPLIAHLPSTLCYFGMMVVVIGFLTGFRTILLTRPLDYKRRDVECVLDLLAYMVPVDRERRRPQYCYTILNVYRPAKSVFSYSGSTQSVPSRRRAKSIS